MLPYLDRVTLWEPGAGNVAWLRRETLRLRGDWPWTPFWEQLADAQPTAYKPVTPRLALAHAATVHQGTVWDLPAARFDVGTMFFVAESMTSEYGIFEAATGRFVRALRPGAPFAAGFMTGSVGYEIAGQEFPAVPVEEPEIADALASVARDVELHPIITGEPVRPGVGMILATGRAR